MKLFLSFLARHLVKIIILVAVIALLYSLHAGYLSEVLHYLNEDGFVFKFGNFSFSPYSIVKSLLAIFVLFSLASLFANFVEIRIRRFRRFNFSTRQLLVKTSQILIYLTTSLVTLRVIGIDLEAFAILGGGIGIGIGIGLQKISSNFISGIILLFEKTLQKDDLVEIDEKTIGFIRKMRGRYTLIETLDNKEIMIPNEDLITQKITNCTLSNKTGRVSVDVGVSYASDIHKVRELMIEAALESTECLQNPQPKCCLVEFGNSSVNFTLYFWMENVASGIIFAKSEVMFKIWDKFKEHGIEIPFPQRDINFKNPIKVDLSK